MVVVVVYYHLCYCSLSVPILCHLRQRVSLRSVSLRRSVLLLALQLVSVRPSRRVFLMSGLWFHCGFLGISGCQDRCSKVVVPI